MGDCAPNYEGILCRSCAINYSINSKYECDNCPKNSVNAIRLSAIILAVVVALALIVRYCAYKFFDNIF